MKRTQTQLVVFCLALAMTSCADNEPRASETTLPTSSAITSVQDVYGVGCPRGWEYRRFRSAALEVHFREPASYGSGPPPIWAEFYPYPDGFFDEDGDPRAFLEASAAASEYLSLIHISEPTRPY